MAGDGGVARLGLLGGDRRRVDPEAVRRATRDLLVAIGEDPEREGLRETPARVAQWWTQFIDHEPQYVATFESDSTDQMVCVSGIRVWSLCEHHLLPFWCDLTVAYIPRGGTILGLSKFARIAREAAGRLQVQERLVAALAGAVGTFARSPDVAVLGRGEHLCMSMRGVRSPAEHGHVLRGAFRSEPETRAEFLALAHGPHRVQGGTL